MKEGETMYRKLIDVIPAQQTLEGGGIRVNRPFPTAAADWFDPFLLLDEMAPTEHAPGGAVTGVPPHPHRGFETVTYMIDGEVEHRDSAGNHGVIGPGDVQWMTAGDGIVHSEMPSERMQTEGGTTHGLQLWVNLPAALRRTTPRYQGLVSSEMPTVRGDGWSAHLVAGELFGEHGPADSHTPVTYAHVTIDPGSTINIPVPDGFTTLTYIISGPAELGEERSIASAQHLAVFDRESGDLLIAAPTANPVRCMVLLGQPIDEPMVRYGPFVMNTSQEIHTAIDDFNAGRMGKIPAAGGTTKIHQPQESLQS